MMYTPDYWQIVKLTEKECGTSTYRILCSWAGGYTHGSSWKLSSGIESVRKEADYLIMKQSSGSVYSLQLSCYRISGIMSDAYQMLVTQYSKVVSIELVDIDVFLQEWERN